MTLYSRYLLWQYFKVWALSLSTCLLFLTVCQLNDIARFAAFGVGMCMVGKFLILQLSFILPIAIAASSLLSAFIIVRRLSQQHELNAFRACGYSLVHLVRPLLVFNAFLSIFTFYINSEVTTATQRTCREMLTQATAINPLSMLQYSATGHLEGSYVRMDAVRPGHEIAHLIIALPSRRLVLYLADSLKLVEGELQGTGMTCFSTLPQKEGFDSLLIENVQETHSPAVELATLLRTRGWRLAHDHLSWRLLSAREQLLKTTPSSKAQKQLRECHSQKMLRIGIGLMPLVFTLLGFAFSISPVRTQNVKGIVMMTFCMFLVLIGLILNKKFSVYSTYATMAIYAPLALSVFLSLVRLHRIEQGRI